MRNMPMKPLKTGKIRLDFVHCAEIYKEVFHNVWHTREWTFAAQKCYNGDIMKYREQTVRLCMEES